MVLRDKELVLLFADKRNRQREKDGFSYVAQRTGTLHKRQGLSAFMLPLGCTRVHAPASPLCPVGLSEATGAVWPAFEGAASIAALCQPPGLTMGLSSPGLPTAWSCLVARQGSDAALTCLHNKVRWQIEGVWWPGLCPHRRETRVQPKPCPDSPRGLAPRRGYPRLCLAFCNHRFPNPQLPKRLQERVQIP